MNKVYTLIAALALVACTDDDNTRRTLRAQGFRDIETTGYAFFGCGDNDAFKTGFRAKNVNGESVEGVVCCGWLKNCTVRF